MSATSCPCGGERRPTRFTSPITGQPRLSDELECDTCGETIIIEATPSEGATPVSAETIDEFMASYASGPDAQRVTIIEIPDDDEADTLSPFIVVKYRNKTVVVNPMGLHDHLCVDVHSFIDGLDATAGVMAMSDGRRFELERTGTTSHGWNSAALVSVLVGAQK